MTDKMTVECWFNGACAAEEITTLGNTDIQDMEIEAAGGEFGFTIWF